MTSIARTKVEAVNDNTPAAIMGASGAVKTMADTVSVGQKFGKLTIVDLSISRPQFRFCICYCECGQYSRIKISSLVYGMTKSCGCMKTVAMHDARRKSNARRSDNPELRRFYAAWCGMKARCNNPKHKDYKYYGAIGIKVCDRWNSFENFKDDMWPRPANMTLDRISPYGNYEPQNCRWATHAEQRMNRRAA